MTAGSAAVAMRWKGAQDEATQRMTRRSLEQEEQTAHSDSTQ